MEVILYPKWNERSMFNMPHYGLAWFSFRRCLQECQAYMTQVLHSTLDSAKTSEWLGEWRYTALPLWNGGPSEGSWGLWLHNWVQTFMVLSMSCAAGVIAKQKKNTISSSELPSYLRKSLPFVRSYLRTFVRTSLTRKSLPFVRSYKLN